MFTRFEGHFCQDGGTRTKSNGPLAHAQEPTTDALVCRLGGASFNNGLYRIMTPEIVAWGNAFVANAFTGFSDRVQAFAFDWLGRVFALDSARIEGGRPGVVLFEPGTGEALEIPCNLSTFHENELVDYKEEALAEGFYRRWLANGGAAPNVDQCVGYKTPLFLGGKDTIENLEISDLDVYWTLVAQLLAKVRGLPLGTRIRKVEIES